MTGCTEQLKPQTASARLSIMLLAAVGLLFSVNNATAQRLAAVALPQQSEEIISAISGLPTLTEISSTKVDDKIKKIVTQLNSPDFASREAAARQLVSENVSRRQICKVLGSDELSPEQRNRLVDWLRHDLLTTPHAAIGISISRRRASDAIIIEALIENLPAIEVLEPGDQIISLDGLLMNNFDQFLQSISSRKPGDSVIVTVNRPIKHDENNDAQESGVRELDFEIILGSDDYLINVDGTKQVNSFVRGALNRDLKTIVEKYGPKILHIKSSETPKLNMGAAAGKQN